MMMKLCLVVSMIALVSGSQSEVSSPVQKVVQLLTGMLEKGKKQLTDEQAQFAEFHKYCTDVVRYKEFAIADETENIQHFTADIRMERATARRLESQVHKLDRDVSSWKGDIRAATKVREMENADYEALHEDYSESVDAIMRAIATLHQEARDHKQTRSGFVQIQALTNLTELELIPASAKKAIDSFVQNGQENLDSLGLSAPEANGYEFQSHGVIGMLEKLLDKFVDERREMEASEENSRRNYETLMKDLNAQIDTDVVRRQGKAVSKTKALQEKAEDKGERSDEKSLRVADTKYKKDLQSTCKVKFAAFKSRQALRHNEIVAIEKAIDIISAGAVAEKDAKHLAGAAMVQKNAGSFASLRTSSNQWNHVATYLQEQALKLNSRMLATVAEKASSSPFTKVKKMIKDLLDRLVEEAAEEASHKGWCDTELTTNAQTRQTKSAYVETLKAEIDEIQAHIAKFSEDITELSKSVAELDAAMTEQTKLRLAEKAKNTETIADAKAAQAAVEQALSVLRDFYADSSDETVESFVQENATPKKVAPKNAAHKNTAHEQVAPKHAAPKHAASEKAAPKPNAAPQNAALRDALKNAHVSKNAVKDALNAAAPKNAVKKATLMQEDAGEPPEIFDTEYTGMGAAGGSVMGMLEVIETDFARLESATRAAEASSKKEYEEFKTDTQVDKTSKAKDLERKETKKQDAEGTLTTKRGDLDGTQKELEAALSYYDKLKPSCVDAGVSYEDRVMQREEEIKSLRHALGVFNGEDLP